MSGWWPRIVSTVCDAAGIIAVTEGVHRGWSDWNMLCAAGGWALSQWFCGRWCGWVDAQGRS